MTDYFLNDYNWCYELMRQCDEARRIADLQHDLDLDAYDEYTTEFYDEE